MSSTDSVEAPYSGSNTDETGSKITGCIWVACGRRGEGCRKQLKKKDAGRFGIDTFGIGEDSSQPVTFDYKPTLRLDGTINKAVLTLE